MMARIPLASAIFILLSELFRAKFSSPPHPPLCTSHDWNGLHGVDYGRTPLSFRDGNAVVRAVPSQIPQCATSFSFHVRMMIGMSFHGFVIMAGIPLASAMAIRFPSCSSQPDSSERRILSVERQEYWNEFASNDRNPVGFRNGTTTVFRVTTTASQFPKCPRILCIAHHYDWDGFARV